MTEILKSAVERGASDIFVVAGLPLTYKVRGEQQRETADGAFTPEKTEAFAAEIYRLAAREPHCLNGSATDDDFSFSLSGTGRFRVNLFRQRGSIAAVVRVIRFGLPTAEEAHIPPEVMRAAQMKKGIVLVTGSAGSGKSTTLACIINEINRTRAGDPFTKVGANQFWVLLPGATGENGGLVSRRVFNRFQKEYPKSGAAYTFKSLDLRHIHMNAEEKATEKTERRKA